MKSGDYTYSHKYTHRATTCAKLFSSQIFPHTSWVRAWPTVNKRNSAITCGIFFHRKCLSDVILNSQNTDQANNQTSP